MPGRQFRSGSAYDSYLGRVGPFEQSLPAELAGEVTSAVLPLGGGLVSRLFSAAVNEVQTNHSRAMEAAVRTSGLSREDLAERMMERRELVPLVTRLLFDTAQTSDRDLLEAMGAAFAAAVQEFERADEVGLTIRGLRNLLAEDIPVLRHLRDRDVFDDRSETGQETEELQTAGGLAGRLDADPERVMFSLNRLAGQGFALGASAFGGSRFSVTGLGRLLCDALERMNGQ